MEVEDCKVILKCLASENSGYGLRYPYCMKGHKCQYRAICKAIVAMLGQPYDSYGALPDYDRWRKERNLKPRGSDG